jgi:predicted anti-sigma-YlaC factor YlaD
MSFDEIVCREFAELATDYLDGAMPEPTLELVEEHLAMCDWCREYLHQIDTTADAVATAEEEGPRFAPAEPAMQDLVGAFRRRREGGPPG